MSGLSLETCTSNLQYVALSSFRAIIDRSAMHKHTQTVVERKQYRQHSFHSLGRDNNVSAILLTECRPMCVLLTVSNTVQEETIKFTE